eukprot:TRINITY_DN14123_c0_g1_i1.p1 TRINITY_DN14123_c0_g1~~TRINITY_DN14123_c0_g1_i1.p1  ORF type:complete len:242 (+),score=38.82 TRINITY_DN14123_c0_g1_i1:72-797(+)
MDKEQVSKMLSDMLQQRMSAPAANNKKLQSWERESRVGADFEDFKYTMEGSKEVITLVEGSNQLGHRVWDTCVQVCKMLEKSPEICKSKRVLELGSGCGLMSLVIHKLGAANVVATDLPAVVDHLEKNIKNCESSNKIQVSTLTWGSPNASTDDVISNVDLVVASDVTITASAVPLLVSTIDTILDKNPTASAIIGGPNHREGWPVFLDACSHFNIFTYPESSLHPDYISKKVSIVKLSRK